MSEAKIVRVFYQHSRETNEFLQSNGSVNRRHYFRILALACIDILLTLPLGVINATSQILTDLHNPLLGYGFQFYYGWAVVHSDWGPVAFSYSSQVNTGFWNCFGLYFQLWTLPVLAITIFVLFGLTSEARVTYWRVFCTAAKLFGWTSPAPKHADLGEIEFGARQLTMTERYVATPRSLMPEPLAHLISFRLRPSFVLSVVGGLDDERR
jgi:hypothetical protein